MADRAAPTRVLAGAVVLPFLMAAAVAPVDRATIVFSFSDPEIVESSGLAVVRGWVVTTNDSGDTGRVFTVDPDSGDTIGTTHWGSDPSDVEALAPAGQTSVWAADIGDNAADRESVSVAPVPVGPGRVDADIPTYDLVYPGGARDAETLLAHPRTGRLYVVSKEIFGGTFFAAPKELKPDSPNRLRRLGEVGAALSLATDGAFFPDGRHVIIRGYTVARVYEFPSLAEVATVDLPSQEQGEGIAVDDAGQVLLSSEGSHSDVLRLRLPKEVREVVSAEPSPSPTTTPSPAEPDPTATAEEAAEPAGNDDRDIPATRRATWPWWLSGIVGVAMLVVLGRSLRRR